MTIPYPFQSEAVNLIERARGRVLLAHSMGLGKSFSSLLWTQKHPEARPIVVVCPASLKWQWAHEAAHHFGMRGIVLEGMKPTTNGIHEMSQLVILNYDILKAWLPYLQSLKPKIIIIDENQAIMDRRTIRSKATKELCRGVPHVLALSGTPLVNRPSELWPTLNILRPDMFPSFWTYAHEFCGAHKAPWGWEFKGASNLDRLNGLLKGIMLRKRKEEVLTELPEKQRTVVPLDIEDRKQYQKAVKDFLGWLAETDPAKVFTAMRAERLVRIGYLKRLAGKLKLPSVMDWIDDFLSQSEDDKLILFAIHRKIIAELHERYSQESVVVDGTIIGKKRQLATEKFLTNKKTRLFIGNIKAAGVGWSARGVSTVAFAELPWTPGALTQAEDRASGIGRGQKGVPCSIYYLIGKDTLEHHLLELIQQKQGVLDAVLDAGKGDNLDIFDQLTKLLMMEGKS